jgi:hypothetical protein
MQTVSPRAEVHTDDYAVVLKEPWYKPDIIVFSIVAARSSEPNILWVNTNSLLVKVDYVSYLGAQLSVVDGISINYQIGKVLHP